MKCFADWMEHYGYPMAIGDSGIIGYMMQYLMEVHKVKSFEFLEMKSISNISSLLEEKIKWRDRYNYRLKIEELLNGNQNNDL